MRSLLLTSCFIFCAVNMLAWQSQKTPASSTTLSQEQKKVRDQHAVSSESPANQTIVIRNQSRPADHDSETKPNPDAIDVERHLAKFTLYLVVVGLLQSIILVVQAILFFQQKEIMGQHKISLEQLATAAEANANAIEAQGVTMGGQLKTMEGQLAAIETTAEAAKASVETEISKERARIKIMVQPLTVVAGPKMVACWLENYGPTPAFIKEVKMKFVYVTERDLVPDYSQCQLILYNESLQANTKMDKGSAVLMEPLDPLTEDQVISIRKEQSFLHFYGFVNYRDVFDRDRRTTIHIRWYMRWEGQLENQIMQWWEPVGAPEENTDK